MLAPFHRKLLKLFKLARRNHFFLRNMISFQRCTFHTVVFHSFCSFLRLTHNQQYYLFARQVPGKLKRTRTCLFAASLATETYSTGRDLNHEDLSSSKSSKTYRRRSLLLALCFIMLLSACGSEPAPVEVKPVIPPQVEKPTTSYEEENKIAVLAPLTGLAWKEGAPDKRPIAVMVNNQKRARPQSGLQQADVLVEVLAEGGITRLVAIYHSNSSYTGEIGPVRSIRPYLIDIGESFGAMLVHAGGSPDGYQILQQENKDYLDEISNAGPYFWRDKKRRAPHNLYTNLKNLQQGLEKKRYATETDVPAFTFRKDITSGTIAALSGEDELATRLQITYSNHSDSVEYRYDKERRHYIRYMEGDPHIDKSTGEPLKAANVIVMYAEHQVVDDVGRLVVNVRDGGQAIVFLDGRAVQGQWSRQNGAFRFEADGQDVALEPGVTHMLIVPNEQAKSDRVVWKP